MINKFLALHLINYTINHIDKELKKKKKKRIYFSFYFFMNGYFLVKNCVDVKNHCGNIEKYVKHAKN